MRCIVFFSGAGSTLRALLQAEERYDYQIARVLTDNPEADGIAYAHQFHKETIVHPYNNTREQWCAKAVQKLAKEPFDVIVLAGFMRILSAGFVQTYQSRILNIHPSLLPKYKGLNTHSRVLENKEQEHGFTIHMVNEKLDDGPILYQHPIPVDQQDNEHSLCQRVQKLERKYYPQILHSVAKGEYDYLLTWHNNNKACSGNNY